MASCSSDGGAQRLDQPLVARLAPGSGERGVFLSNPVLTFWLMAIAL